MSFLSLLLFASAFYFVHGRPDEAMSSVITTFDAVAKAVYAEAIDPITFMSNSEHVIPEYVRPYYDQVSGFVEEVHKAVDTHLKPIILGVGEETGNLIMSVIFNRLHDEFKYIMDLINDGAVNPTGGFNPLESPYPFYEK